VRGRGERSIRKFQEKPKEGGVSLEFDIIDDNEYVVHRYSTTLCRTGVVGFMDLVLRKYSTISIPLPPLKPEGCGRLQWCRGLMTDSRYGSECVVCLARN